MYGVPFSRKSTNVETEHLSSAPGAKEDCITSQSSSESPSFFPLEGLAGRVPSMILFITIGGVLISGNGTCPVNT